MEDIQQTADHKNYSIPNVDTEIERIKESSKEPTIPIYFDGEGKIYNINFQQIPEEIHKKQSKQKEKKPTELNKKQKLLKEYEPHDLFELPKFPNIPDYKTFSDYEQAVLSWKIDIENKIGYCNLPHVLGRVYPRPFLHKEQSEKTFDFTDLSSDSQTPRSSDARKLSETQPILIKKSLSKDEDFPKTIQPKLQKGDTLPEFLEGTYLLMNRKESWKNRLIPSPPSAFHFSSYEEYEKAYKRWAKITIKTVPKIPLHSDQFSEIYGVITRQEKEKKRLLRKEVETALLFHRVAKKKRKKQMNKINFYYIWNEKINYLNSFTALNCNSTAYEVLNYITNGKTLRKRKEEEWKEMEQKQKEEEKEQAKKYQEKTQAKKDEEERTMILKLSLVNDIANVSKLSRTDPSRGTWFSIDKKYKEQITQFIQTLFQRRQRNLNEFKSFTKPLVGKMHGILPKSQILSVELGAIEKSNFLDYQEILAKRRNDLPRQIINETYDCPVEIKGQMTLFTIPKYDLSFSLNLESCSNFDYNSKCREQLSKIEREYQLQKLNSWYYPTKLSPQLLQNERREVEELIKNDEISTDILLEILKKPMKLDIFTEMLADSIIFRNREYPYIQLFLSCITQDNLHIVLSLLESSSSFLIHTKVAQFISETLQRNFAKSLIEKMINERDIKNMYYIAYSMNLLDGIYIQPIPPKFSHIITNDEYEKIEKSMLCYYYLDLINQKVTKPDQKFLYLTLATDISKIKTELIKTIIELIYCNSGFVKNHVFKYFASNSYSISRYYVFIFENLILMQENAITQIFQSNETNILEKFGQLSRSKLSHIRFGLRRIWNLMIRKEDWKNFLIKKFSENIHILMSSMSPLIPNKKEDDESEFIENDEQDRKPPYFIILLHDFFEIILKKSDAKMEHNSLLNELVTHEVFMQLLSRLGYYIKECLDNETLIYIASIMRMFVNVFSKFHLIHTKATGNPNNKNHLIIEYQELKDLLYIVSAAPRSLDKMKAYIFSILCKFVQSEEVFSLFKQNPSSFAQIISFFHQCKSAELGKKLWKFVFVTMLYNQGFVTYLIESDQYKSLNSLISSSSHPSILDNGLTTLSDVFNISLFEEKRLEMNFPPSRPNTKNSVKSIEKEAKNFNKFYLENVFFVKIHMVYKNLKSNKIDGKRLINLSKVYRAISKNPLCAKIYSSCMKNENYKEGFLFLESLLEDADPKSKKGSIIKTLKSTFHIKRKTQSNTNPTLLEKN